MSNHKWGDDCVQEVRMDGHENNRQLVLKEESISMFVFIYREDVIALAKDFNLVVYPADANL